MNLSPILIFAGALACIGSIGQSQEKELPKGLEDLKFRYDVEVTRVLDPIQRNYIKALEELQKRYTEAGDLEGANKTREEIARAQRWETLPIDIMRRQEFSKLDQEAFGVWLRGKRFDFLAKSGSVSVTFDEKQVNWKRGGRTFKYSYTVNSNREVTVKGTGSSIFKMVLDEDHQAGTLESALGNYDVKISDRK